MTDYSTYDLYCKELIYQHEQKMKQYEENEKRHKRVMKQLNDFDKELNDVLLNGSSDDIKSMCDKLTSILGQR